MTPEEFEPLLGPALAKALTERGYASLTSVQEAVLDPELAARDLRITSQTGSGKTLAIGFALRALVAEPARAEKGVAKPRALVVTPTRELARQVEEELGWLFAGCAGRVASVAGGSGYRDEVRALARGPAIVVATPGRLLDHLRNGAIDPTGITAVAIDEADRMLELGFKDELDAILEQVPAERRTVLVSATFPRDVRALADRVQRQPAHVEGTRLGTANLDIDHVLHVVENRQKVDAIVNLLLASPDTQTLVFAHTRSRVGEIAEELAQAGFSVSALSGEMDQRARTRALAAFKRGDLRVLVATDVAARGIDVQDIARVIQVDVPTAADSYTHRSGRTGRAGRKGISSLLVAPAGVEQALRLLGRAGVSHRFEPIPTADAIRRAADERVLAELVRDAAPGDPPEDARVRALAERLLAQPTPERAVARLLASTRLGGVAEPRDVRAHEPPKPSRERRREADGRHGERAGGWVPFRVSWGARHGADPRRLLALVCRRGGVRGSEIGAIYVEPLFSIVHVESGSADAFARAASRPDPRDPRVVIRREGGPDRRPGSHAPRDRKPYRRGKPERGRS
jgi:ATP-dependent RNA helicase DeaD